MKLVLIGGGSFVFAPSVLNDAIVENRLAGSEIVLVDVDREIVSAMAEVGRRIAAEAGVDVRVSATTERASALPDADFVVFSAAVEGARRWRVDREILAAAGLADQVRECGGLGGLSYSLRSITLALDVAHDMERLCPHATLLDATNPMPRVVTAVSRYTRVPAIGFCNVAWQGATGYDWLARLVDRRKEEIAVTTAGLNHFAWLVEIRDRQTGEDLRPAVERAIERGDTLEMVRLRRWVADYDAVGCSGVGHMAEYLPTDPERRNLERPPFHGDASQRQRRREDLQAIAAGQADWRSLLAHRSWERPVDVAAALSRKQQRHFDILNIPNRGYLPGLPEGRVVEVPAEASGGRLLGQAGLRLSAKVIELLRTISDVHETVVEAAVKGDRALLARAVEIDPAVDDKLGALGVLGQLIDAQVDVLPQFASRRRSWEGGLVGRGPATLGGGAPS